MPLARQPDTTLVIFDFSGTLSLDAVEVGKPEVLGRQLAKSGLAGIGIDTPDRYWHDVVMPTWPAASTGQMGFKLIAADRIREIQFPGATFQAIESAVSEFVETYMRRSVVDERWRPLLADILGLPGVTGVVATDHYAEATAAIQSHLTSLKIASRPVTGGEGSVEENALMVANSADIGYLKANRRFWLAVKHAVGALPVKQVLLVDDFGLNEFDHSGYAETEKIAKRITLTRQALQDVFKIDPQIIHFILGENRAGAIADTIKTVREMLAQ